MLVASHGKAIRFKEEDVRPMGRGAAGVRGIKLPDGHEVIALAIVGEGMLLSATENGFGKRTAIDDFPVQGRGRSGRHRDPDHRKKWQDGRRDPGG